jgi:hypothetical protein
MDACDPITAAVFSAFLKCPTKAHLLVIGEPAPGAFFANIEARISSMYKAAAKRRLGVGTGRPEFLDFAQVRGGIDYEARTYHVDCETAVYDFAPPSDRPGGGQPQDSSPSGALTPFCFYPGTSRSLPTICSLFRCARAVASHQDTGRHRKTDLGGPPPQNREDRRPRSPDAPNHRRDWYVMSRSESAPPRPEQALRRLRLPDEVSRPRYRTRRFEPAQRDDCQGAGKMQCEGNLLDNAAVVRLPSATTQTQT